MRVVAQVDPEPLDGEHHPGRRPRRCRPAVGRRAGGPAPRRIRRWGTRRGTCLGRRSSPRTVRPSGKGDFHGSTGPRRASRIGSLAIRSAFDRLAPVIDGLGAGRIRGRSSRAWYDWTSKAPAKSPCPGLNRRTRYAPMGAAGVEPDGLVEGAELRELGLAGDQEPASGVVDFQLVRLAGRVGVLAVLRLADDPPQGHFLTRAGTPGGRCRGRPGGSAPARNLVRHAEGRARRVAAVETRYWREYSDPGGCQAGGRVRRDDRRGAACPSSP